MAHVWRLEKPRTEMDHIFSYAPGTAERERLLQRLETLGQHPEDIPLIIAGRPVETGDLFEVRCPHRHQQVLARAHQATQQELKRAIEAALAAQASWAALDWYQRAAVFLRAADLLAGPHRIEHIAAIMVNQSKTPFEAEIDLAELVDFWRFNAFYLQFLYAQQPDQAPGEINRFDWRPLEGFVLAIPPFNFYSIGGNLATAPAMAGNVVLWKPARSVLLANYRIMQVLQEAGLPEGVINFVPFSHRDSEVVLQHPALAGVHFTGSYETLVQLWQHISANLPEYHNFPRIVGETGGKDFIVAHPSADVEALAANVIRGAFEYQGQKCSAASRLYVPNTLWEPLKARLRQELPAVKVGAVEDLSVCLGAIISEEAFNKVVTYLDHAREHPDTYEIIYGGETDQAHGWFVRPTVIVAQDPHGKLMTEEIFGPVLTVLVYPDNAYEETLKRCDTSTGYGLTGSIFARDRQAIAQAEAILRHAAGNFYINDKPTGAVVGRQPFGGARRSGTNDKAGSWVNMMRWLSPRTIKETLVPARDWRRPYLEKGK
jgi:1-pyrroline-5-carboxylate dehydrogenase